MAALPVPAIPSPQRPEIRRILADPQPQSLAGPAPLVTGAAPASGGVIQRAVENETEDIWKTLKFAQVQTKEGPEQKKEKERLASLAMRRLLSLPEGIELVKQLGKIFGGKNKPIKIYFVDELSKDYENAGGYAEPEQAGAPEYFVFIKNQAYVPGNLWVEDWPSAKAPLRIVRQSADAVSGMAMVLFHELLHILFMNTPGKRRYWTGHGKNVNEGEFDTHFFNRLVKFSAEQDALTGQKR